MILTWFEAYLEHKQYIHSWITLNQHALASVRSSHPSEWTGQLWWLCASVINRQSWRWGSKREHKCPALTPPDCDLQCCLPVFGEPAWPPWTQCTQDLSTGNTRWPHQHIIFIRLRNNSWESHKVCQIMPEREQKRKESLCLRGLTSVITRGSLN